MPKGIKLEIIDKISQTALQSTKQKTSIQRAIEDYIKKIKTSDKASILSHSSSQGELTLSKIEIFNSNNKYRSFIDFAKDIRDMFSGYFEAYQNKDKISSVYSLNDHSEHLLKQMDSNIPERQSHSFQNIQPMTEEQKHALGQNIKALKKDNIMKVIKMLSGYESQEKNSRFFSFDMNRLPPHKCYELYNFVKSCLKDNYKEYTSLSQNTEGNNKEVNKTQNNQSANKNTSGMSNQHTNVQNTVGERNEDNSAKKQRVENKNNEEQESDESSESDSNLD
jgi:hypothetical protein